MIPTQTDIGDHRPPQKLLLLWNDLFDQRTRVRLISWPGVFSHPIVGIDPNDDHVLHRPHCPQRLARFIHGPLLTLKRFLGKEQVLTVLHVHDWVTSRGCSRRIREAHKREAGELDRVSWKAVGPVWRTAPDRDLGNTGRQPGHPSRPSAATDWPYRPVYVVTADEARLEIQVRLVGLQFERRCVAVLTDLHRLDRSVPIQFRTQDQLAVIRRVANDALSG